MLSECVSTSSGESFNACVGFFSLMVEERPRAVGMDSIHIGKQPYARKSPSEEGSRQASSRLISRCINNISSLTFDLLRIRVSEEKRFWLSCLDFLKSTCFPA
jgi:hypothetical protein